MYKFKLVSMGKKPVAYTLLFSAVILIAIVMMIGQLPSAHANTPVQFRITHINTTTATTSVSTTSLNTTTIPTNNTCNTLVMLYVGHNDTCAPFTASLTDLGQPNSNGTSPASFSIYYGNVLTNTTNLYPNQSATFTVHGIQSKLYVYQTFAGLYVYQKWAKVSFGLTNTITTTSTSSVSTSSTTVPGRLYTAFSTAQYQNLGSKSIKTIIEPAELLLYNFNSTTSYMYDLTPYELTGLKNSSAGANKVKLVYSGIGSNLWISPTNPLLVTVDGYTSKNSIAPVSEVVVFENGTNLVLTLPISLYGLTGIMPSRALPGTLTISVENSSTTNALNITNNTANSTSVATTLGELKSVNPVGFTISSNTTYYNANFTSLVKKTSASPKKKGIQEWFTYSYPTNPNSIVPIVNSTYGVSEQPEFQVDFNYTNVTTTTTTSIIPHLVTTFTEKGLPKNGIFEVTYYNTTESTTSNILHFSTLAGNYTFTVYNYTPSNTVRYVPVNIIATHLAAGSTFNVTYVKLSGTFVPSNTTNSTYINGTNIYNTSINTSATGVSTAKVNGVINQIVNFFTGIFNGIAKAL